MQYAKLGRTDLTVSKNSFGALPIQRIPEKDAVYLLKKAFCNNINYFDTARAYSDSEEKLGAALCRVRGKVIISTKTGAHTVKDFWTDLNKSLSCLQTDYIDIYQFHNLAFCPTPGDDSGLYDAMLEAKRQGKIRFVGITSHKLSIARQAVESGLYDTLQYPFSYLATDADLAVVLSCKQSNMGFIAMKALSGGLITNAAAAYAYQAQFDHVAPIWGIQRESELNEFIAFNEDPPVINDAMKIQIERDRQELAGDFCRGCGYCMPCPAGIQINNCARISLLLRRSPQEAWLSEKWRKEMRKIENCLDCNKCSSKCPYQLNTPELLRKNYEDYKTFL